MGFRPRMAIDRGLTKYSWRVLGLTVMLLVAAACVSGCAEPEPEEPEQPPPPPPPSAQQLHGQIMSKINPLLASGGEEAGKMIVQALQTELPKVKAELNGPSAIKLVGIDVNKALLAQQEAGNWEVVLNLCEAYDVIDPTNQRTKRYRNRAETELSRPRVRVQGFYDDHTTGVKTVFLEVTHPRSGEMKQVQVREGEQFEGLELVSIQGDNKILRFRHIATDKTFEVHAGGR